MFGFEMSRLIALILAASAIGFSAPAGAEEYKAGDLTIDQPWIRATPAGARTAGAYVKIKNSGRAPDKLLGGSAEGAGKVEVHEMTMDNNVMKMRELKDGLPIGAGAAVELKPGGYHLMLMGLKQHFAPGDIVKGTLTFEKAGRVPVEFKVQGMGEGHGGHGH